MRFATLAIIVGSLSTLNTVVPARGQTNDGTTSFTERTKQTEPTTSTITSKDGPFPGLLYPRESESREVCSSFRKIFFNHF